MMKSFTDQSGRRWIATAREEDTPRHHGRWYLVFQAADQPDRELAMSEVRWQTAASARRTLETMSDFELRRRVHLLLERERVEEGASPDTGAQPGLARERTSVNAG